MGKRIVFGALIVVLLLLLPSAVAYAGEPNGPKGDPKGNAYGQDEEQSKGLGPGGQGKSHAPQNASRGMNRPGSAGQWKDNGHVPAPVSDPQGHAPSDPDFTGNGGIDKPGETGGFDADRDGNNGCGNDSDREDDNNGWCGKKPKPSAEEPPPPSPPPPPPGPPTVRVLPGPKITRTAPGALPRTGVDLVQIMWLATGMTLSGHALRKRARRAR